MPKETAATSNPEDGCGLCGKKASRTARNLVATYIGDNVRYVDKEHFAEWVEAQQTLWNAWRKCYGLDPDVFRQFMR